jgi:hypothetical protein
LEDTANDRNISRQLASPLQWKLFIRRRASATQDTPPGRDELKWVANTATLIYGQDFIRADDETQTASDWHTDCRNALRG